MNVLSIIPTTIVDLLLVLNFILAIAVTITLVISRYVNPIKYPRLPVIVTLLFLWWQFMIIGPIVATIVLLVLKLRHEKRDMQM